MEHGGLRYVVDLYRAAGCPSIHESGCFVGDIDYSICSALIEKARCLDVRVGRFESLEVDGRDVIQSDDFPSHGDNIKFEWKLSSGGASRFYKNLDDLLSSSKSIGKGIVPDEFYLIEDDYFYDDLPMPCGVESMVAACKAITLLSRLAQYHDDKTSSKNYRLVFVHA